LTSFESLFLVKFEASTLGESHQLFVKLSCKSACENIDDTQHDLQYAFCSHYCSWARSYRGRHCDYIFIFTRFLYAPTHVKSKLS